MEKYFNLETGGFILKSALSKQWRSHPFPRWWAAVLGPRAAGHAAARGGVPQRTAAHHASAAREPPEHQGWRHSAPPDGAAWLPCGLLPGGAGAKADAVGAAHYSAAATADPSHDRRGGRPRALQPAQGAARTRRARSRRPRRGRVGHRGRAKPLQRGRHPGPPPAAAARRRAPADGHAAVRRRRRCPRPLL
eukprot:1374362-Prymnesium_polylepis.1